MTFRIVGESSTMSRRRSLGTTRPGGSGPLLRSLSGVFAICGFCPCSDLDDGLAFGSMAKAVLTLDLRSQEDVLLTRRRARDLAALLQFTPAEQIGLSTAVWEVARLAEPGGKVELAVVDSPPSVAVRITVAGVPRSVVTVTADGPPLDLDALGRLVDRVEARDVNGKAVIRLSAAAGPDAWVPGIDELELVLASLTRHDTDTGGPGILDELRQQNFELLTTLATLREREQELTHLNSELGDTNRAVTALYAELEVQAAELRRRAESNASFLSSLTHELRTPLYAVRGMTEAILRDHEADLNDGMRQDVTLIDGAMVEALDLVNDHLDLAKLAAGRTTVRLSDVDVPELFATLRAVVTKLPAHAGVTLHFDEADGVPAVRTDGFKLSQILRNFIVNALKFTEAGHVRVRADAVDDGDRVRFEVTDTGPGLSEEDQTRAFEEFVQLGAERHGELRGTGLGLPLTRRLAAILGGEVGVRSTLGEGATFSVTIPCRYPTPPPDGVEPIES
jgi:signal transduction histidine kinase